MKKISTLAHKGIIIPPTCLVWIQVNQLSLRQTTWPGDLQSQMHSVPIFNTVQNVTSPEPEVKPRNYA